MFKKKPKAAAAAPKEAPAAAAKDAAPDASTAPKKRSKLKLALLAVVPLVLGGGGYAGWTFYAGAGEGHAEAAAEGHGEHGAAASGEHGAAEHGAGEEGHGENAEGHDETRVSSIEPNPEAESSFTYSFALSELLQRQCGGVEIKALKAESIKEAETNGLLVSQAWVAANRRLDSITEKSCNRMLVEIEGAEARAVALAEPKKDEKAGAHH